MSLSHESNTHITPEQLPDAAVSQDMPALLPAVTEDAPATSGDEDTFEYRQLVGHRRTDRSIKTDEQLRSEYVRLTDGLIQQMTEGVMVADPRTGEMTRKVPDAVVWLDKSARPLAWMTGALWDAMAANADGNVPKKPDFYFANIDREQWVNTIDPEGVGSVDASNLDPSVIRSLRSIYVKPQDKKDGITEAIDDAPAALDNKTVLIIDEVQSSGRTLKFASNFYAKAFPTASIAGTYWMAGTVMKGGAKGNADLPVWYKEHTARGRGVGDRNPQRSAQSRSLTQQLGGWFLSTPVPGETPDDFSPETGNYKTPLRERDPASWQLRKEIGRLAVDVKNGDMLVVPSYERDMDDADERALRLNPRFSNIEDFYAAVRAQNEQGKSKR